MNPMADSSILLLNLAKDDKYIVAIGLNKLLVLTLGPLL